MERIIQSAIARALAGGEIAFLGTAADQVGSRRLVTVDAVGATNDKTPIRRRNALARLTGELRNRLERIDEAVLTSSDPEMHTEQARAI